MHNEDRKEKHILEGRQLQDFNGSYSGFSNGCEVDIVFEGERDMAPLEDSAAGQTLHTTAMRELPFSARKSNKQGRNNEG